ncbi:hypothetical protein Q1695_010562 [Nippostrongylus brasiliensis]|nr:hypothetical protein Q1695_010562 [Nippostrongylus brasiliensis]
MTQIYLPLRNPDGFLDPRETFEHYENRSRPNSSQSFEPSGSHGRLACDYRAAPPPTVSQHGRLACEYRAPPPAAESHGRMACEYRAPPPGSGPHGVLACDYRSAPPLDARYGIGDVPPGSTKITTYLPESRKRKIPLRVIISVAICVPITLIICLFGAVWLQELGIL